MLASTRKWSLTQAARYRDMERTRQALPPHPPGLEHPLRPRSLTGGAPPHAFEGQSATQINCSSEASPGWLQDTIRAREPIGV